jgi:putative ABC transport system substrate-binding protein
MYFLYKRREFIALLGGAGAAWPLAARAQQDERVRRIGMLVPQDQDSPVAQARIAALLQKLRQLGWTGRNVRIDIHWARADAENIRKHAVELVTLAPDVILANGSVVVTPLLQATGTVPIELRHLCGQFPHSRARAKSPSAIPDRGAAIRGNASFA